MPTCFDDEKQWKQYQLLWKLSQGQTRVRFCTDCTPEYRNEMTAKGRCAHPETVFIQQPDGETVGVDGTYWGSWVNALSGRRGTVLSKPPADIRDSFMREKFGADPETALLDKESRRVLKSERIRERREKIRKQVIEMREKGMSFAAIGFALGISDGTASRYFSK